VSKELTKRQKEILGFIEDFLHENKYPPSLKEIGDNFKISQKGSYDHIKALQKKKHISFEPKKRRSIKVLVYSKKYKEENEMYQEIPLLGTVQAGLPILSEQNFEGKIKIAKNMFGKGELFGLRVRGDSMNDEGILEGDIAIVNFINHFENGEIVVVDTGNGVTIKKAYKEKSGLRLEAANKKYSSILTRTARIIGKLVGLFRTYD
jgi:repressor LexA